jgi:division/cell wall cluster transcriptional repressor MraZ
VAITLLGKWVGSIDGKRRLTLPAAIRRPLAQVTAAQQLIITVGTRGCLLLIPDVTWDAFAPDLFRDAVQGDPGALRLRSTMALYGSVCRVDKSGRVTLSEEQMQFGGLEKLGKAIVFANFNHIEIWEPSRFESAVTTTSAAEHDLLAARYFGNLHPPGGPA